MLFGELSYGSGGLSDSVYVLGGNADEEEDEVNRDID